MWAEPVLEVDAGDAAVLVPQQIPPPHFSFVEERAWSEGEVAYSPFAGFDLVHVHHEQSCSANHEDKRKKSLMSFLSSVDIIHSLFEFCIWFALFLLLVFFFS